MKERLLDVIKWGLIIIIEPVQYLNVIQIQLVIKADNKS
jgi:hypothetical protein